MLNRLSHSGAPIFILTLETERESERACEQGEGQREKEKESQAISPPRAEPNEGLDP